MSFENKVVIITGAGSGIGRSCAVAYAEHDARVIIADKNFDSALAVEKAIKAKGGTAAAYVVDISVPAQIKAFFEKAYCLYGQIDILINNAGFVFWKSLYELTVDEWDLVINTNLRGTFLCCREAATVMKKKAGGYIVNIASTRALMSEPHSESYAASKGGLLSLTHSLAVSLGPDGIRVNAVSPGWIETGDYSKLREADHMQHPSGRVGVPADIVRACFFLTDDQNGFITGTNLVVDGGMTRKMIYEP